MTFPSTLKKIVIGASLRLLAITARPALSAIGLITATGLTVGLVISAVFGVIYVACGVKK